MAIKLPETKILTCDELRAEYMTQHRTFTQKVEDAVLDLIAYHRQDYEALVFKNWSSFHAPIHRSLMRKS